MKVNISGANIRKYRLESGISEGELADGMCMLGRKITETRIREMEEGNTKVYDMDLAAIGAVLNRSLKELLE